MTQLSESGNFHREHDRPCFSTEKVLVLLIRSDLISLGVFNFFGGFSAQMSIPTCPSMDEDRTMESCQALAVAILFFGNKCLETHYVA